MDRWSDWGLAGLMIFKGRGLKPRLSIQDNPVVELVKKKSSNAHEI